MSVEYSQIMLIYITEVSNYLIAIVGVRGVSLKSSNAR